MITGFITLGPDGIELVPRRDTERAGAHAELLLSPQLYADDEAGAPWPGAADNRAYARVGKRRVVTSGLVLDAVHRLADDGNAVRVIPAETVVPRSAWSDANPPGSSCGLGDAVGKVDRRLNASHRRSRFRLRTSSRNRWILTAVWILAVAAAAGMTFTANVARAAQHTLGYARERLASERTRAESMIDARREATSLAEELDRLDRIPLLEPLRLIGTLSSILHGSAPGAYIERITLDRLHVSISVAGDAGIAGKQLEALPYFTDVTVETRLDGRGGTHSEVTGRIGE